MRKRGKPKLAVISFIFLLIITSFTKDKGFFEGEILVTRETPYDTATYSLMVKNNIVRVDNLDKSNGLLERILIDLQEKEITFLDPRTKMYTLKEKKGISFAMDENCEVIKSDNYKIINGYKCYQWRVKNRLLNSEVTYWVAKMDNIGFFLSMIDALQQPENSFRFFLQIPGNEGYFPMMTVERTLVRNEKYRFNVTNISSASLNDGVFEIPAGYRNIRNQTR